MIVAKTKPGFSFRKHPCEKRSPAWLYHASVTEHPFAGEHVSVAGRLALFSRRDLRTLVERLGGSFSADITPRTTLVVAAPDAE